MKLQRITTKTFGCPVYHVCVCVCLHVYDRISQPGANPLLDMLRRRGRKKKDRITVKYKAARERPREGDARPESNMTGVKVFQLGQMSQSNVCSGHYGSLPVILCTCMCVCVCVRCCFSSEECQESLSLNVSLPRQALLSTGLISPFSSSIPSSLPPSFSLFYL